MRKPKTVCLQGDPGSGKSMMAGLTALRKPVHFIDVDRKLASAEWAQKGLESGEITVWELAEPMSDSNIASRLKSLASDITKAKPLVQPQGIPILSEYFYKISKDPIALAAGTWVIDSATMVNEHAKSTIAFWAERSKMAFDQWTTLKSWWMETVSVVRDTAREHDKDLIFTVHERFKEEPGDKTRGVEVTVDAKGNPVRNIIGVQDIKVWASIDGAFGDLLGTQMDEYYWLYSEMKDGRPVWRCRVHPDGRRSLRTSFTLTQSVFDPDFRQIWK